MKKDLFIFIFILSCCFSFSQQRETDSLMAIIKLNKRDSVEFRTRDKLASSKMEDEPDNAISMINENLKLAEELKMKRGIGGCYLRLGNCYGFKGDYSRASFYHFKALAVFEELEKQAAPQNKVLFSRAIASCYDGLGGAYEDMGNLEKALEYYTKSAAIDEKVNNVKGLGGKYNNIGGVYGKMEDHEKSLFYFRKALRLNIETQNENWQAINYLNIGNILEQQKKYDSALVYYKWSLDLNQKLDNLRETGLSMGNLGSLYYRSGDLSKSESYLKQSLAISLETGDLQGIELMNRNLYDLYKKQEKHELALKHFEGYRSARDSLVNAEKSEQLLRNEMNYEFEIKQAQIKAEQDKKDALADVDKRKQQLVTVLVSSGLILLFILIAFMLRSLLITRRQKKVIEVRNAETQRQKEIIESQHHDILDSIHYAKRIQQSLLPTEKYITKHLAKKI